jgi:hypothetical protein
MRLVLFSVALAFAACDRQQPSPAPAEANAVVGRRSVSFVSAMLPVDGHALRFRIHAPPGHPLYLDHCNGAFSWGLEHRVAGTWKPAWIVATNACHSAPIVIPPGRSRDFTQTVVLNAEETLRADTYRLAVYGLYSDHSSEHHAASTAVPRESRVSEPFAFGPLTAP